MNKLKENKNYIILFFLLLIIMFLSPICGDDWSNYLEGTNGLRHMFTEAIGMYFDWEGRFISRILINILTYYKPLWNFVNSFALVSMIYLIIKIIKPKHPKTCFYLTVLLIPMMNIFTISQVVVWLAGNITYLLVIPLLLFYFYTVFDSKKHSKKTIILLALLNMIMTMFVENMGVVLVVANILILINRYLKTKKIDKEILTYLIASIVGLLSMLLSPGTAKRSKTENIYFNELSLFGKIFYNIPNFIFYTFTSNYYLLILMSIANYYLVKNFIKNKKLRIISYLYLLIFPIITIFLYLLKTFAIISFNLNNSFILIYYIIYILIDLYLLFIFTKKNKKSKVLFFYLIGMASNFVMLVSPTWGPRTSLGTYIFLSISYLMIIDKYLKKNKVLDQILLIGNCTLYILYLILYITIHKQYVYNYNSIKKALANNDKVIYLKRYPAYVNCNINPDNPFHLEKFKKYYNIPEDTEIVLEENNWKYLIFYNEKD